MCQYVGVPRFDYNNLSERKAAIVEVNGERFHLGFYKCEQSAEVAMVADRLLLAAGGQRKNFPTEELQKQVGCFSYYGHGVCVVGCVHVSRRR
jgi:hypothetical protein